MRKRIYIIAIFLIFICVNNANTQAPEVQWEKIYGDTTWNDYGLGCFQTSDGGYILGGNCQSWNGNWHEVVLFKLDSNGDTLWSAAETGTDSTESAERFGLMTNGSYMFVGASDQDTSSGQAYLYNADPDGSYGWTGLYGDMDPPQAATAVAACADTAYVITTSFWEDSEYGYDIRMYYLDMFGWESWTEHYYSIVGDRAECITPLENGDFIITGKSQNPEWYDYELLLLRVGYFGGLQVWQMLGDSRDNGGEWVIETEDNGFLAVGWTTETNEISRDVYIVKTNDACVPEWDKVYGFTGSQDAGTYCAKTGDGGYLVAATCGAYDSWDFWLLRLNADGDTLWTKIIEREYNQSVYTVDITDDGGFILGGATQTPRGDYDMYAVKLGPETDIKERPANLPSSLTSLQNYPNPFNASTTISFNIDKKQPVRIVLYDALGREIKTIFSKTCEAGKHRFNFDGSMLNTGVYFYTIYAGDTSATNKMVIIK